MHKVDIQIFYLLSVVVLANSLMRSLQLRFSTGHWNRVPKGGTELFFAKDFRLDIGVMLSNFC